MKKVVVIGAVVTACWLSLTSVAGAGHIDLPTKWSQLPDIDVSPLDIRAEHEVVAGGQVVADDFQCTHPHPIVAVRWWGSYLNAVYEPTAVRHLPFELSLHTGDRSPPPNSEPADNPEVFFVDAQEEYYGTDSTGINIYEYNAYIPPWLQTVDQIYWLDVELDVSYLNWPFYTWGWHNSQDQWRDKAVASTVSHNGPWQKLCTDMSFELMIPEPCTLTILSVGALLLRRRRERAM